MMTVSMEDIIEEVLAGKKRNRAEKITAPIELKNEEINLQRIFEDDTPPAPAAAQSQEQTPATKNNDSKEKTDDQTSGELAPEDATAKKSRDEAEKHVPVGDKVMEVSLSISDVDYGKIEIGSKEYESITDLSALLGLFDVNARDLTDPKKAVNKISLSIEETISSSTKNIVSLAMQLNPDDTMSISVKVGDLGQPFTDLDKALMYFNTQYQSNVWDIINKSLGSK